MPGTAEGQPMATPGYLAFHPNPKKPGLALPANACDAHCHVSGRRPGFPSLPAVPMYRSTRRRRRCSSAIVTSAFRVRSSCRRAATAPTTRRCWMRCEPGVTTIAASPWSPRTSRSDLSRRCATPVCAECASTSSSDWGRQAPGRLPHDPGQDRAARLACRRLLRRRGSGGAGAVPAQYRGPGGHRPYGTRTSGTGSHVEAFPVAGRPPGR